MPTVTIKKEDIKLSLLIVHSVEETFRSLKWTKYLKKDNNNMDILLDQLEEARFNVNKESNKLLGLLEEAVEILQLNLTEALDNDSVDDVAYTVDLIVRINEALGYGEPK